MFRVLVTGRNFGSISPKDFDYFKNQGYELVDNPYKGKLPSEDELCAVIPDIDAILIGNDQITPRVLEHANRLKVISKFGIGVDNIDIPAATKRQIAVTNVPGTTANSVADLTFGLMLGISKLIVYTNRRVMSGMWPVDRGNDIHGKTLGIVGFGRIGQAVAKRAAGFDMKILAYDVAPDKDAAKALGVELVSLDVIVAQSDYITLHIPRTEKSYRLFDREMISKMKKGSFLINVARGGIVDEDALYEALQSNHLAGAATDVLEEEPPTTRPKVFDCENFVVTSHSGGNSQESILLTAKIAAQNIIQVLENQPCPNVVNREGLDDIASL